MSDSIWKKDLSLRRKPKTSEPELPPEPIAPVAAVGPPVDTTDIPNLPAGDYGWLTSNFDPEAVPDDMPVVAAPEVTLPARVPEPQAAVSTPTVAAPAVTPPAVTPPAEPKQRRELKLPKR